MRDYQQTAVAFLLKKGMERGGALIEDVTRLGKMAVMQVSTFASNTAHERRGDATIRPTLLIVPVSMKPQTVTSWDAFMGNERGPPE